MTKNHNSKTQLAKSFFQSSYFPIVKKTIVLKENCFPFKLFFSSLKIYSITLDLDPNFAKIQDSDSNTWNFDPQH